MKNFKFLFRPVSPFIINQNFGENKACVDKNNKVIFKEQEAKCPVGTKSVYSQMLGHNGLDLHAKRYTPIYSAQDCIVEEVVDEKVRGLGLGLITTRKYYCFETKTFEYFKIRYWHNALHNVRKGDNVAIGDLIAWADNTGYSSGDHLHFELKPVSVKFNKDGTIKSVTNILQDNGYFGAVDPMPYLRGEDAVKLQGIKSIYERILWTIS